MGSARHLFFLSQIITHLVGLTISQPNFLFHVCDFDKGNYTADSPYGRNLENALSNLNLATNNNYGFYNYSYGETPDKVNALALCRRDVGLDACGSCVNDSISKIRQLCPNQMEAIGWYDYCMLRYSNHSIFNTLETSPIVSMSNVFNVSAVVVFNQALITLLDSLRTQAAEVKFGTGLTIGPDFSTIYALLQCTPDLSVSQCDKCLNESISYIPICCFAKLGGRVFTPSCYLRYEAYAFYHTLPTLAPQPRPGKDDNTTQTVIIIVVSTVIFVILVCTCIFIVKRRRERQTKEKFLMEEISSVESLQYDFSTIRVATNNFADSNKLGQGGIGVVYKGRLTNGKEIAVKKLSMVSKQDEVEFKNEVFLVAKLRHKSLVRLLGFCMEGTKRILIYEFMPNASLDLFIFDPLKRSYLDWDRRHKIIEGVAQGILFLHEDSRFRIDVKATKVLLDAEMNPKIYGICMESGFMEAEYASPGNFSMKSDVFNFGVLVLEIISGQKNHCFRNGENVEDLSSYVSTNMMDKLLASHLKSELMLTLFEKLLDQAWKNWREGTTSNVIDPTLRAAGSSSIADIIRCTQIALLCVQENADDRPTMASVILMVSDFSVVLQAPLKPAFFMHAR